MGQCDFYVVYFDNFLLEMEFCVDEYYGYVEFRFVEFEVIGFQEDMVVNLEGELLLVLFEEIIIIEEVVLVLEVEMFVEYEIIGEQEEVFVQFQVDGVLEIVFEVGNVGLLFLFLIYFRMDMLEVFFVDQFW